MSPCQRSLKQLRAEGWLAAVVEKWNSHGRVRQDLFGFIDVLAIRGDDIIAIQATTMGNMREREAKIRAHPNFLLWLGPTYHRHVYIHGWAKRGPRGKRKVWTCKVFRVFPN